MPLDFAVHGMVLQVGEARERDTCFIRDVLERLRPIPKVASKGFGAIGHAIGPRAGRLFPDAGLRELDED